MGYSCEAAIDLKVDDIESQKLSVEQIEAFKNVIITLKNKKLLVWNNNIENQFFNELNYYLSFTNSKQNITHPLLGSLFSFSGTYDLEKYIFEYDNYVGSPVEILEIYLFCFYFSKQKPKSKLNLGIGDSGYFWSEIELMNGEILNIESKYADDYDYESIGFSCTDLEIKQFFLGLNIKWYEEESANDIDLENYYIQKNKEIFLNGLEKNPFLFEKADDSIKRDKEVVLKILKQAGDLFEFIDESLKSDNEIIFTALKSSASSFQYLPDSLKNNKEITLFAMQNDYFGDTIPFLNQDYLDDISLIKKVLKNNPHFFTFLEDNFKSNCDIAKIAIEQDGMLLEYCSDKLRNDFDLVLSAIQHDGYALIFASEKLQKDYNIVYQAVKQDGQALEYADPNFRDSEELILLAIQTCPESFLLSSERIKTNPSILRKIVSVNLNTLQYFPTEFKYNKDFLSEILVDFPYKIIEGKDYFEVWMTTNLSSESFSNGEKIDQINSKEDWLKNGQLGKAAYCYYQNNPIHNEKLGKLYNWSAINDSRKLILNGWRVTTQNDWMNLIEKVYLQGKKTFNDFESKSTVTSKLKTNVSDFEEAKDVNNEYEAIDKIISRVFEIDDENQTWDGTDEHGLNLLPGGKRAVYTTTDFSGINQSVLYWCADYDYLTSSPKLDKTLGNGWCFELNKEYSIHLCSLETGAYVRLVLNL